MNTHDILTVRPGGVIMRETGHYDTTTHRWVSQSSRVATDAECHPFKNQGIISLHQPTTMNTPTTGKSGSSNTHARLSPSAAKQWTVCTSAPQFLEENRMRILPIKINEVLKLTPYLKHIEDETHDYERRAIVLCEDLQAGRTAQADLSEQDIGDIERTSGSEAAREGTRAHDWAERVLNGKCALEDAPWVLKDAIAIYIEHCRSLVPKGVTPYIEAKVPLFYDPESYGTCDFAVVTDERIWIRDYKHGAGVLVYAEENEQLAIYALSFVRSLTEDGMFDFAPKTVIDIGIVQPRHHDGAEIRNWVITMAELEKFCEPIMDVAQHINEGGDTTFAPGDDACRWCDAKGFCFARASWISASAEKPDASGLVALCETTEIPAAKAKKMTVVDRLELMSGMTLDDDKLLALFEKTKAITGFLDDVSEYVTSRVLTGDDFDGRMKIVTGRAGNTAWKDEEEADKFLKGQKLKEDERYNYKLKSPTQIEAMLKDKFEKSTRAKNIFLSLTTRADGKPVAALASDKRPALSLQQLTALPDEADEI